MTDLQRVIAFEVPREKALEAEKALRRAGAEGYECFVLWTGIVQEGVFRARTTRVPEQTGYRLNEGVCVRVEAPALHRLNVDLFDAGEQLAIQAHTHPGLAYHSATDDAFPIATQLGALSLVVPDFAMRGLLPPDVALYRLYERGWVDVDTSILRLS